MFEAAVSLWSINGEIGVSDNDAQFSLPQDRRCESR